MSHERAFQMLPWLVNGTVSGPEKVALEAHVRDCIPCRSELKQQTVLAGLVAGQKDIHLSADAGFEQLMRRIDDKPVRAFTTRLRSHATRFARSRLAAAAVVVVGLTLVLATVQMQPDANSEFATLGSASVAGAAHLDVIFRDDVSAREIRAALLDVGTVVAGPSDVGRYTVAVTGGANLDATIQRLRNDRRIRFAGRSFMEIPEP